jgi:hypothetical protein
MRLLDGGFSTNKTTCWFLLVGLCRLIRVTSAYAVDGVLAPSLVAGWTLDDGAGTAAVDSSGNGNEGVFVGTPTRASPPYERLL